MAPSVEITSTWRGFFFSNTKSNYNLKNLRTYSVNRIVFAYRWI